MHNTAKLTILSELLWIEVLSILTQLSYRLSIFNDKYFKMIKHNVLKIMY